jgi:hypothetical protein
MVSPSGTADTGNLSLDWTDAGECGRDGVYRDAGEKETWTQKKPRQRAGEHDKESESFVEAHGL